MKYRFARLKPDNSINLAAVFEDLKRGNALNAESGGGLLICINIQLADENFAV